MSRGARGSEDAGTSSETGVGIPRAESPRFPGEGSSSQGQPGPKGKPGRRTRWAAGRHSCAGRRLPARDGRDTVSGVLDAPVRGRDSGPQPGKRLGELHGKAAPEKRARRQPAPARTADRHRWAGRACRGERGNRGQGTRQNSPVTSGEGALARASRRDQAQATVYQKHRTLLKAQADV